MTTKSTRPSWVVSLSGSKEGPFAGRYFGSVHFGGDPLWRATKHRTIGRADTMACIARTQSLQGHKVRWVNAQVFRFVAGEVADEPEPRSEFTKVTEARREE